MDIKLPNKLENNISLELNEIVLDFAKGKDLNHLPPAMIELLNLYFNDKNSSTLRQYITSKLCGYNNSFKKLGYDAIDENNQHKEIKPTNFSSTTKKVYSGQFGFSDYTESRFSKDVQNDVKILQSFFVDGELMFIIEHPIIDLSARMDKLIKKHIIQNKQRYIRSATFSFNNLNPQNIKVKYISKNIEKYEHLISKKLYKFIMSKNVNNQYVGGSENTNAF